jgi:F-type H+-transporting ATPase subunit gamma
MANLKEIRRRIKTVKSTEKITLAMKMVAAAKVKRAENKLKANQPYAKTLGSLFSRIYDKLALQADQFESSPYVSLIQPRDVKRVGIVLVGSDRGLCGSYSSSILKQGLLLEKAYREQGIEPVFYLVGNKMHRSFPVFSRAKILGQLGNMTAAPTSADAQLIIERMLDAFKADEIDAIQILYTRFVSMLVYKPVLLPLMPATQVLDSPDLAHLMPPVTVETSGESTRNSSELLLEPSPIDVFNAVVPTYLQNQMYAALLEASASELAARMTAMSNASKNATDLIDRLTLEYNKARQAAITQEILEIVGGANALK